MSKDVPHRLTFLMHSHRECQSSVGLEGLELWTCWKKCFAGVDSVFQVHARPRLSACG